MKGEPLRKLSNFINTLS